MIRFTGLVGRAADRGRAPETAHLAVGGDDVQLFPRRLQWSSPGRCGDWQTPPPSPPRASAHDRHGERGAGTFTWPSAGTSRWPPVGTLARPRTGGLAQWAVTETRPDQDFYRRPVSGVVGRLWPSCGPSADSVRTKRRVDSCLGHRLRSSTRPSHRSLSDCAGRRKGASRPYGMGLRPTLPPTLRSRRGLVGEIGWSAG